MKLHLKPTFLIAVAVFVATASYALYLHREWQSKVEWSVLQAAEANNRENSEAANVILCSDSEYHLAGIINTGKKPVLSDPPKVDRVWILLDSKYPPVVKILDTEGAEFSLRRTDFDKIMAYARARAEVASVLRKHIR